MKRSILFLLILGALLPGFAQVNGGQPKEVMGQRRYDLIVTQANDTLAFNRGLRALRGNSAKLANRGILADLATGYLSMGTSALISASQNLLGAGMAWVKEAARDKRPDWQNAVSGENRFVKRLPMFTEILDFYGAPSQIGALDPTNMKFSGFGCRQYIVVNDADGNPREEEVFYLSCKLRDDEEGLARMLNHSKFEVVVDELRFNPYLCNLPNDTISVSPDTRFAFDFDKRRDLQFNVVATLKSSWINEAIQVVNDAVLGQFVINAKIDPKYIGEDNVFRYKRDEDAESGKVVTVTGDAFLVPRSYVGSSDMSNPGASWGTGQYKVEMDITESCLINEPYYTYVDGGKRKWRKDRWGEEWKLMKQRPSRSMSPKITDIIFPQFSGDNWITTIAEPATTVLLTNEGMLINSSAEKLKSKINGKSASAAGAAAMGAGAAQGGAAQGGAAAYGGKK